MSMALTYLLMSDAEQVHAVELIKFLKALKADRYAVYKEVLSFAGQLDLDGFEVDCLISEIKACYVKSSLKATIVDALLYYRSTLERRDLAGAFDE